MTPAKADCGFRAPPAPRLHDQYHLHVFVFESVSARTRDLVSEPIAHVLENRSKKLAERVGFEPTVRFPAHTLSKRAPSATRTPLRNGILFYPTNPWPPEIRSAHGTMPVPTPASTRRDHIQICRPPWQILADTRWRRGWDSNPRTPYGVNGFRDRPFQPLRHLSAVRTIGFLAFRSARRMNRTKKLIAGFPVHEYPIGVVRLFLLRRVFCFPETPSLKPDAPRNRNDVRNIPPTSVFLLFFPAAPSAVIPGNYKQTPAGRKLDSPEFPVDFFRWLPGVLLQLDPGVSPLPVDRLPRGRNRFFWPARRDSPAADPAPRSIVPQGCIAPIP